MRSLRKALQSFVRSLVIRGDQDQGDVWSFCLHDLVNIAVHVCHLRAGRPIALCFNKNYWLVTVWDGEIALGGLSSDSGELTAGLELVAEYLAHKGLGEILQSAPSFLPFEGFPTAATKAFDEDVASRWLEIYGGGHRGG